MIGTPSKVMTRTQGLTDVKQRILFCDEKHLKKTAQYYFERDQKSVYDISTRDLDSPLIHRYKQLVKKGYSLVFKGNGRSKILIYNAQ